MVANYKRKRHIEMNDRDLQRVNHLNLEGSERMRAKKLVRQGLEDFEDERDRSIESEEEWEREMEMAYECYLREKADPENYKCTCYETKDENDG